MGCNHNYVFTQGYFVCTKCGKRSYGRSYKRKQGKKAGIGITLAIIGIVAFLFYNGTLEFNQNNLEKSIQDVQNNLPPLPTQISEPVISNIKKIEPEIKKQIESIGKPQTLTENDAIEALEYINKLRIQNGKSPINHDSRVYDLALARAQDMYEYDYIDHTNPITGTCPYNIKSDFGLTTNENVAENAYLSEVNGSPSLYNPSMKSVIDDWMDSTGHRMNLLSYEHVSGSVACYGGYCVFLGLNHGNYGEGCYTAAEGQAYAARFDACTPQQMQEYERMLQEYDKIPPVTSSEAEYQRAMNLYNKIENFRC